MKKLKKTEIKRLKNEIEEQNNYFLKDHFFHSCAIEALRSLDVDKEIIKYIDKYFYFEILEQCSEYGMSISYLDFSEIMYENKDNFFNFLKVDIDDYINKMKIYVEEMNLAS